jgi:hypothetical protein
MRYVLATITFLIAGCGDLGSLSDSGKLRVVVYGVYTAPESATGNATPEHYELSFSRLQLTQSTGTIVDLSPATTETLRIIDRPQIVYESDLKDYVDSSFSNVSLLFDSQVLVGGKYNSGYDLTLSDPLISEAAEFTVYEGEDIEIAVMIQWRNTIERDTEAKSESVQAPTFDVQVR